MDFHDFEKFNGKNMDDIFVIERKSYRWNEGKIDGIDVCIEFRVETNVADVWLKNGNVIGYFVCTDGMWIFNACGEIWLDNEK